MPKVPLIFLESLSLRRVPEADLTACGFAYLGEVQTSWPDSTSYCRLMVSHRAVSIWAVDKSLAGSASSCC